MNRRQISAGFGFLLLLGCFAYSLLGVFGREREARADNVRTITFAHWQLESGIREALDVLARDYEALHPDVRVRQIAIPERIYPQWIRTQLVGGTASDIIQLGIGMDDEIAARYFLPLSKEVEAPNPYNSGTELAALAWRDTFLDGMNGGWGYRGNLLDYYGVPLSMFTTRVYYNRSLWRLVLGDTPEPADYEAFLRVCERVREHSERHGVTLLPIAGSRANGPMLVDKLFHSQTQRLYQELNLLPHLRPGGADIGLGLLRGDWSLRHPGFLDALAIAREVGGFLQPGYQSLGREDATFYFIQSRALMIATGSWDSPSFRAQAPFEIGVFDVPLPTRDHPRYGRNTLGPLSEAEIGTGLSFGITRLSRDADLALDFLRFVTSRAGNARFSEISGWLPSVIGVEPAPEIAPFLPVADGYVNGFDINLNYVGSDSRRVIDAAQNTLIGPAGGVERFVGVLERELPAAIRQDLERLVRDSRHNLSRQDVIGAAYLFLSRHEPALAAEAADRRSRILEGQVQQEAYAAWIRHELKRLAVP
jgi:raffinose/stachyose/melibiose transport system substrate-binding protein